MAYVCRRCGGLGSHVAQTAPYSYAAALPVSGADAHHRRDLEYRHTGGGAQQGAECAALATYGVRVGVS